MATVPALSHGVYVLIIHRALVFSAADLVMNMILALCVIFKIVTIKNAVAGFANTGLLTVVGA